MEFFFLEKLKKQKWLCKNFLIRQMEPPNHKSFRQNTEEDAPNIVPHIVKMIIAHIDETTNSKVFHQIDISDYFTGPSISSPFFVLDYASENVLEFPFGMEKNGNGFDWFSNRRNAAGKIIQKNIWPPDGCRIHSNIQAFVDSIFSRFYMDWSYLGDETQEELVATLETHITRMEFFDDQSYASSKSHSCVMIPTHLTSDKMDNCIKTHFVNLLNDLKTAIWVKPAVQNE